MTAKSLTALAVTLLLAGWSALVGVIVTGNSFRHWHSPPNSSRVDQSQFAHDATKDPMVGSVLELEDQQSISSTSDGRILVVAMGDCNGCSANSFKLDRLDVDSYSKVVLIYAASKEDVSRVSVPKNDRFKIIGDADRSLHSMLNASWTPRFYSCSGQFKVMEIQKHPFETPDFVIFRQMDVN